MKAKLLFEQLINKQDLQPNQVREVFENCINGEFNDVQIGTFLALMRAKGESADELASAAYILQQWATVIDLGSNLIDIVGTGGDGKNTFNVSTACSFVVGASGIKVAKHGNRSVSSNSGSADLLEAAGFVLDLDDNATQACMKQCNLAFLFAPHYHPAMQKVRNARQQLGIRTLFNLLGPLINPAKVRRQVVGVFSEKWLQALSNVLIKLGSERHLVINSQDGLDEISIAAPTKVLEYRKGIITEWFINPEDYQLHHNNLDAIIVSSPGESLALIESVLNGTKGAARDMVVLNSAAAIYCAKDDIHFKDAIEIAKSTLDSGKAALCFQELRDLSQKKGNQ